MWRTKATRFVSRTLLESVVFHAAELDWTWFDGLVEHVAIYLADAAGTVFIAVAVAVSYYEFHVVKESTVIDQVAVVFD